MLHWVAFFVIGLAAGAALWSQAGRRNTGLLPALVGGLVGGLIGGRGLLLLLGYPAAKYLSLLASLVLAAVIAWVAQRLMR